MATEMEKLTAMLSAHMEATQRQHDESSKTLRNLSVAVIGDEELGVPGMVKRVDKLEKQEANRKKRDWVIFGAASVSGFSLSKIGTFIAGLFGHH